jgi:hypothetical protein
MQMASNLNRVFAHQKQNAPFGMQGTIELIIIQSHTALYVAKTAASIYIWLARMERSVLTVRCSARPFSPFAYMRARERGHNRERASYMQVSFVFPRGTRSEWVSERAACWAE